MDREAILAEIRSAFEGFTRDGGMSWSEAILANVYGPDDDGVESRWQDDGKDWEAVASDPEWPAEPKKGGFSFLDATGYRYYLPAAMTVALNDGPCEYLGYSLQPSKEEGVRN